MATALNTQDASRLNASFLEEYSTEESIRKYTGKTAGYGIAYLLDHDYGRIYREVIERYIPRSRRDAGLRIWEFGCGSGMNLLHLVSVLRRAGIKVDFACGTDFSGTLITAAQKEAARYLAPEDLQKVRFAVASNEGLMEESTRALGIDKSALLGSFDLVIGVNTIRYGHRLNNVDRCVRDISGLLRDGGICVVIDMNRGFPAFRSRLRESRPKQDDRATFLPSLDEYAQPFSGAGFQILRKRNFCWIPHSAGAALTGVMRALSPVLNTVIPSRAMRSLVISRKIASGRK